MRLPNTVTWSTSFTALWHLCSGYVELCISILINTMDMMYNWLLHKLHKCSLKHYFLLWVYLNIFWIKFIIIWIILIFKLLFSTFLSLINFLLIHKLSSTVRKYAKFQLNWTLGSGIIFKYMSWIGSCHYADTYAAVMLNYVFRYWLTQWIWCTTGFCINSTSVH